MFQMGYESRVVLADLVDPFSYKFLAFLIFNPFGIFLGAIFYLPFLDLNGLILNLSDLLGLF